MRPRGDVPAIALTKQEAAISLGLSHTAFVRHVYPDLKVIRRGTVVLIPVAELERWTRENASLA